MSNTSIKSVRELIDMAFGETDVSIKLNLTCILQVGSSYSISDLQKKTKTVVIFS